MDTTTADTSTTETRSPVGDAAAGAQGAVKDATAQAQEKLHGAADQAREQASRAGGQAKDRVRGQVDQRSTEFGERAGTTAEDIRSISQQLREQGKDQPAKLADQAADRVEQAARYLKDADADRFLHDLENVGRQRPWAVITGGLAIGFAASRLLKTTSADRYHGARNGGTGQPRVGTPSGFAGAGTPPLPRTVPGPGATAPPTAPRTSGDTASLGGFPETAATGPAPGYGAASAASPAAPDAPFVTGPDPVTTTHRDRESGISHGDL